MKGESPPPAKKPLPVPSLGLLKLGHQAVVGAIWQVRFGLFSNWNCGGGWLLAKLTGVTSYAKPAPPRTAHLPCPRGSQAKPKRGAKLFLSALGARKNNPRAGSSAIASKACNASSRGTLLNSYRKPRFRTRRGVTLTSSCTNP